MRAQRRDRGARRKGRDSQQRKFCGTWVGLRNRLGGGGSSSSTCWSSSSSSSEITISGGFGIVFVPGTTTRPMSFFLREEGRCCAGKLRRQRQFALCLRRSPHRIMGNLWGAEKKPTPKGDLACYVIWAARLERRRATFLTVMMWQSC